MSKIKTAAELIEKLKELDADTPLVCVFYTADDVRVSMDGYTCTKTGGDTIDGKTDKELLEDFNSAYSGKEDNAYFEACTSVGASYDDFDEEDYDAEDYDDDEEDE